MNILVTGGTGTVGSTVVTKLIASGYNPHVLVRSPEKAATLPPGAKAAPGNLQSPATLDSALSGIDSLFLLTALAPDETQQGLNAVESAARAGVRRIVYMSIHHVESAPHIPHFGSKLPIQDAIAASGLEYTFIQPNNFFQVDKWFQVPILQYGIYPQPLGRKGANRVDVRDIADAIVNALTRDGHNGQAYPLIGNGLLNGDTIAAIWSQYLGKEIRYAGDDLNAWAAQAATAMPDWLVHDLRIMYAHFQEHGLLASPEEFALQAKILGHEPRKFTDYVAEVAARWQSLATEAHA